MAKQITNEFNALGATADFGQPEHRRFIASGAITAYTAVVWDVTNLATTGLRVKAPAGADPVTVVGVAQNAALAAGDEVDVIVAGPSKMLGSATISANLPLGVTTTTGTSKAAVANSTTAKTIGYSLEATAAATNTWMVVQPGIFGA